MLTLDYFRNNYFNAEEENKTSFIRKYNKEQISMIYFDAFGVYPPIKYNKEDIIKRLVAKCKDKNELIFK